MPACAATRNEVHGIDRVLYDVTSQPWHDQIGMMRQ
jgi:hypothetical protein